MKLRLLALFLVTTAPLAADILDTLEPLPDDPPQAVALFHASVKGDIGEVKNLVGGGAPIDAPIGKPRYTPLIAAACKGHADVVKCLLDFHAKPDLVDTNHCSALLQACWNHDLDSSEALINAGANVNLASVYGQTALMYAAQHGDDRVVQDLIAHKAVLDANCNQGTALLWAAANNQFSTVKLLADAGANVNLGPKGGPGDHYSALGCAAANNNLQMVDYLLSKGADINGAGGAKGYTPLMAAIGHKRPEAVADLLAKGADIDHKNAQGFTSLMMAADDCDVDAVKGLLAQHASPDVTDPRGETALTIAGNIGEFEIVDALKDAGAKQTDLHVIATPDPPQPLPPAQSWALAVSAIYDQRGSFNPKILGGGATAGERRTMLKRDWGITDKATLLAQIDDLRKSGQRTEMRNEGAKLAELDDADFEKAEQDHPDVAAKLAALRTAYNKWKDRTGLAWDLCRAANLVNAGYAAKYLTEDEAWQNLAGIAQDTQKAFTSWREMSDNFLDGRELWDGKRDLHFEACASLLLDDKDPNSPWTRNAWATDLGK